MSTQYNMGNPNGMPNHGLANGMANTGIPEPPKANQACLTCRKQKRKCDKALPGCSLCQRMNRHCDYSDSTPQPTAEDYQALKREMAELKSIMQGGNGGGNVMLSPSMTYATTSNSLSGPEAMAQQAQGYIPPQEYIWQGVQNRFPAITFLDSDASQTGGYVQTQPTKLEEANRNSITVPKPNIEIPNVSKYVLISLRINQVTVLYREEKWY